MSYVYDDGGRSDAGFSGNASDCVCRAFAIATGKPYKEVYDLINAVGKRNAYKSKRRAGDGISTARSGVYKDDIREIADLLGMKWHPVMKVGSGCTMHLKSGEVPYGRIVCSVSKHLVAVIDGVIHDTYDSTRDGERCVYGYWSFD